MRQIEVVTQAAARAVFQRPAIRYEVRDEMHLSETDRLYRQLRALVAAGRYGQAEDLLFDLREVDNPTHLALALDFYQQLNELDEQTLAHGNFSRREVYDGLCAVLSRFQLELY